MTRTTTSRPRMAAIYAPGTVRARTSSPGRSRWCRRCSTVAAPVPSQTFAVASPTPDSTRTATVAAIPDDPAPSSTPASSSSSTSRALVMSPDRMGPDRLYVPSLGIYASLDGVKFSSGSLDIPREAWRVGRDVWSAPLRAGAGTTLLAGHVDAGRQRDILFGEQRGTPGD